MSKRACWFLTVFNLVFCPSIYGLDNCFNKVFVHNSPDDNVVFGTGMLLEAVVSHRAECVSLCQLQYGCNMILYKPSSTQCRLQKYQHTQAGTGVSTTGWINYARQCSEPPSDMICDLPDVTSVDECAPCLLADNTWRYDHFCTVFRTQFANNGGISNKVPLSFRLEAGMNIIARGSMFTATEFVGVCLESQTQGSAHMGILFKLSPNLCDVYDEFNNIRCDSFSSVVTPSSITFTYILTNSVIKLHLDGTFVREYPNVMTRDRLDLFGFSDVEYAVIIQSPQSCFLP